MFEINMDKPNDPRLSLLTMPTLVFADEVKPSPSWIAPIHEHNVAEIIFMCGGISYMQINGKNYRMNAGDIVLLNPNTLHYEYADKNYLRESFGLRISNFQFEGLPRDHLIRRDQLPFFETGDNYDCFNSLIRAIYNEYKKYNFEFFSPLGQHMLMCLLNLLPYCRSIYQPSLSHSQNQKRSALFGEDIKEFLDKNYMYNINLENVAEALHFSQYHIAHVFKNEYGLTINQYVTQRRIGEAQVLLIDTNMSIEDISKAVGYSNLTHFYATFKKIKGIPPNAFRKVINDKL